MSDLADEKKDSSSSKVGEPFSMQKEIGLDVGLFEPPRISYSISETESGSRTYTSSFLLETSGKVIKSNEPLFGFRRCDIEIETVPKLERDNLGGIRFYEDEFQKSAGGYIGKFWLELDIQFIRDLLFFLHINYLPGQILEPPIDGYQYNLPQIKGLDLTLDNERRFAKPTETNAARRLITYEIKGFNFELYTPTYSQYRTKLQELLNAERRFCDGADALDHNGREVSPLSLRAERWSLLGGIRTCYQEYYEFDIIIHNVVSDIITALPSYKNIGDNEAVIRKFSHDEGYEQVKTLLRKLDI